MAETVVDTIADIRAVYPDIGSDDKVLRMLNKAHVELTEEFRLVLDTIYIRLDGESREYSLPEGVLAVWSAEYIESDEYPRRIAETSADYLDSQLGAWRLPTKGIPQQWYEWGDEGAPMIGFDPIPDGETSPDSDSGFPIVRLKVTMRQTLRKPAEGHSEYITSLPATLLTNEPYVAHVCYQFAKQTNKKDLPLRKQLFEETRAKLEMYHARKQRRNPPDAPGWRPMGAQRA